MPSIILQVSNAEASLAKKKQQCLARTLLVLWLIIGIDYPLKPGATKKKKLCHSAYITVSKGTRVYLLQYSCADHGVLWVPLTVFVRNFLTPLTSYKPNGEASSTNPIRTYDCMKLDNVIGVLFSPNIWLNIFQNKQNKQHFNASQKEWLVFFDSLITSH